LPPPEDQSVAAWWARFLILKATLESLDAENRDRADYDENDPEWNAVFAAETFTLTGPIQTKADAIAKLQAVLRSHDIGERGDGADRQALTDVAAWIERLPDIFTSGEGALRK
jgi:hypothetical protein